MATLAPISSISLNYLDTDPPNPADLAFSRNVVSKQQQALQLKQLEQLERKKLLWNRFKSFLYTIGALAGGVVLFKGVGTIGKSGIHRDIYHKVKDIYGKKLPLNHVEFDKFLIQHSSETGLKNNQIHVGLVQMPASTQTGLVVLNRRANGVYTRYQPLRSMFVLDHDGIIKDVHIGDTSEFYFYGVPMKLSKEQGLKPASSIMASAGWARIFNKNHASPYGNTSRRLPSSEFVAHGRGNWLTETFGWIAGMEFFEMLFDAMFFMFA